MGSGNTNVLRTGGTCYISRKDLDSFGTSAYRSGFSKVGRDYEGMEFDEGIVVPPSEKRRKLSPNQLYVEDKYEVVSSEGAHSSLTDEDSSSDDQEPGQIDVEDFSHAPNISTSRWAFDDDLDEDACEVKGGKYVKGKSSSPESGVSQREDSDCSGYRSTGSDKGYGLGIYSEDEFPQRDLGVSDDSELELDGGGDDDDVLMPAIPESRKGNMLQACRSVFEYEQLGRINEGSYGIVYKAKDKKTGELVALKKLKLEREREGFPLHFLREINTHLAFDHPSIVNVREVVVDDSSDGFDNIFMVMDYMEHDLKALMQARKQPFSQSEVKCLMMQLLEGVKYLHDNWVLHRDLKTSNLLLNDKGELKICDFGMSRQYGSHMNAYTALVVTLWYRAPELLLGAKEYSTALDMWSVGCIMAELLTNKPLFDGKTELEQLNKIFRLLGTPNDKILPNYSKYPGVKANFVKANFVRQPHNLLHKKFPRSSFTASPSLSDLGLDLLSKLLAYDPEKRLTVDEALSHCWFQEAPLPMPKDYMPNFQAEKVALIR